MRDKHAMPILDKIGNYVWQTRRANMVKLCNYVWQTCCVTSG